MSTRCCNKQATCHEGIITSFLAVCHMDLQAKCKTLGESLHSVWHVHSGRENPLPNISQHQLVSWIIIKPFIMKTKMSENIKECLNSLACPSLWTCRVSFTSAKQKIHPLKSTVLHIQKPSLNPPVDISHEWMLQRCQEHLGLLNFLLFSHHTPLTVCKNQQQHKDPPLWEQRRSQSPGTPDKQGASSVIPRTTATLQQAHSGGFCMRTPCIYMMQGPPRFTQPDGVQVSELFHVVPRCVCVSECARVYVRVCVCACVWKPSSHTVTCCDSSTLTEQTSQPLAHSGLKPGATFELQL